MVGCLIVTYTQTWDRENRLQTVTGSNGHTATYTYDADGQRIKKEADGQTTIYFGNLYEKNLTTNTVTTYYYAGAQRVAQRQGTAVAYFVGDHLGSTSLTADANGVEVGRQKYYPYGAPRMQSGNLKTDYRFTGQRSEEANVGSLYDYGARFYSPILGRFVSADTLVPDPANPQALNRYSYTLNNPLRYTDPSGYFSEDEIRDYLDVDNWDAVLAMFGEDGRFAGLWGWLEVLRNAEIGSTFGVYSADRFQKFYGSFTESSGGRLSVKGWYLDEGNWSNASGRWVYIDRKIASSLPPEAAAWLGSGGGYYVDGISIGAQDKFQHPEFDSSRINIQDLQDELQSAGATAGGAVGAFGATHGNVPLVLLGGALVVNGIRVDVTSGIRSVAEFANGNISSWQLAMDLAVIAGSYTPAGAYVDAFSLGQTIGQGLYRTP